MARDLTRQHVDRARLSDEELVRLFRQEADITAIRVLEERLEVDSEEHRRQIRLAALGYRRSKQSFRDFRFQHLRQGANDLAGSIDDASLAKLVRTTGCSGALASLENQYTAQRCDRVLLACVQYRASRGSFGDCLTGLREEQGIAGLTYGNLSEEELARFVQVGQGDDAPLETLCAKTKRHFLDPLYENNPELRQKYRTTITDLLRDALSKAARQYARRRTSFVKVVQSRVMQTLLDYRCELSDEELVLLCRQKNKDEEAWKTLYRRYREMICGSWKKSSNLAWFYLRDCNAMRSMFGEVLLETVKGYDPQRSKFKTYLGRVAYSRGCNAIREHSEFRRNRLTFRQADLPENDRALLDAVAPSSFGSALRSEKWDLFCEALNCELEESQFLIRLCMERPAATEEQLRVMLHEAGFPERQGRGVGNFKRRTLDRMRDYVSKLQNEQTGLEMGHGNQE
jgi:hypothetical protein